MKIILCIFLLNITAASVFGQSLELNGILGESVKFPAAVKKVGSLMHSSATIGYVTDGSFRALRNEKFSGRLQWDSSTGFFSLSGLKMEDSGEYKVQNTDQNINTVFQLNVYIPVSKPRVSITHNEHPCTIECTAERGTGATLSWYREGEKKPYVSSRVESAPGLYLPAPVKRSGTYTCEAKNSVSNEKASITVGAHCTASSSTGIIVASVIAAVAILIAVVFAVLYYCFKRRRQGVRTLRRVKELLGNVDPHKYDETMPALPPDAVRSFIEVKKLLDNMDPGAFGFKRRPEGIIRELRANRSKHSTKDGETMLEFPPGGKTNKVLSPDAVRTLIDVTKLLIDLFLHASGKTSLDLSPDVKKLFDDFDLHTDGKTSLDLSPDVVRTLMDVKKLFDDFDLRTDVK